MSDFNITDDMDPIETREWLESIDSVMKTHGPERAHYIINFQLQRQPKNLIIRITWR